MENSTTYSIFFWWSVISTITSVLFLIWDIYQLAAGKKEKEIHKSQVKIWQHFASGINHGILAIDQSIEQNKISALKDVQVSLRSVLPQTYSLYSSLNEERLFSEEEIKNKQIETEKNMQKLFQTPVNNQEKRPLD